MPHFSEVFDQNPEISSLKAYTKVYIGVVISQADYIFQHFEVGYRRVCKREQTLSGPWVEHLILRLGDIWPRVGKAVYKMCLTKCYVFNLKFFMIFFLYICVNIW